MKFVLCKEGSYPSLEECSPSEYLNYLNQINDTGESLLDYIVSCECRGHCFYESFLGGFLITVDGEPWGKTLGEFWASFTWMSALYYLLKNTDNPCKEEAYPWEYGYIELQR